MPKISELDADASISGSEQVVLNDGGTTKRATVDNVLARIDARINVPTDTEKTTPTDTDVFAIWDSIRKKVTRANIKATLKTYFDTLYVALTGDQTVAGVKTFSSFPVTPSSYPTTDYQTANKKYVDDNISKLIKVAGENLTEGNALRMANAYAGETITFAGNGVANANCFIGYNTSYRKTGQSFTLTTGGNLVSVLVSLKKTGSPTGTLSMKIFADSDVTTPLVTFGSVTEASLTTGFTDKTFSYSAGDYLLVPGTYRWSIETSRSDDTINYSMVEEHGSGGYAGGTNYSITSTNVWNSTDRDTDMVITLNTTGETAGRVYKTDADFTFRVNCIGFANSTQSAGNNVVIDQTYSNKQNTLLTGATYYLSNTAGGISSTAGTVSKVIGKAISTTELLINLFG